MEKTALTNPDSVIARAIEGRMKRIIERAPPRKERKIIELTPKAPIVNTPDPSIGVSTPIGETRRVIEKSTTSKSPIVVEEVVDKPRRIIEKNVKPKSEKVVDVVENPSRKKKPKYAGDEKKSIKGALAVGAGV